MKRYLLGVKGHKNAIYVPKEGRRSFGQLYPYVVYLVFVFNDFF